MSDDAPTDASGVEVRELPSREAPDLQYRLIVRADDTRTEYDLPEGETILGRAERCDVQVDAAGVQTRHLCVKRNGDRLFGRTVGEAPVQLTDEDESLDPEPRRLSPDQPLQFGAATAVIRRVDPADRQAAVEISALEAEDVESIPVRERLGDEAGHVDEEAHRQLRELNAALLRDAHRDAHEPEVLLEALYDCIAPPAAALFRQDPEAPNERWMCTAVHGSATPPPPPAADDEWDAVQVDTEPPLALVARLPESDQPEWQETLCRHVLLLASLSYRRAGGASSSDTAETPPDAVWDDFVGSAVREHLRASTDPCRYAESVLVLGETGTGKELAAQALHHNLWPCEGPLVALNCAAVPEELLDAELFGVKEGAATGVEARPGRFEQAQGGTLFLDEIAEMPTPLQSKLLRVLQERTYVRLGGTELLEADVRIVAASNRPEPTLRDGSHMRPDLYFRLAQATLTIPPLRDRPSDLPALCEHFLEQLEREHGRGVRGLSRGALRVMQRYSWPGNVRELKNTLRTVYAHTPPGKLATRAQLPDALREAADAQEDSPPAEETDSADASPSSAPESSDLPQQPDAAVAPAPLGDDRSIPDDKSLDDLVTETERRIIERTLERHERVADAADALDLSTSYLYRKIKDLDIEKDEHLS